MKTYEAVRKAAEALSADQLKPFTLKLSWVKGNALKGVASLEKREGELRQRFKKYVSPSPRLLVLIDALVEVTAVVARAKPYAAGIAKLAEPVFSDRAVLMGQLETWGMINAVPMNEVQLIKRGSGVIDAAQDVLAIIVLSRQFPKAKLMNSEAELKAMVERATALLAVAKPIDQPRERGALDDAMEVQSRVWTLLCQQYEEVWRYGALLYGRDVDAYVPSLGFRLAKRRGSKSTSPVPAPT